MKILVNRLCEYCEIWSYTLRNMKQKTIYIFCEIYWIGWMEFIFGVYGHPRFATYLILVYLMTSPIFRSFHWITYCGTNWQQHSIYTYFHLSWHGIEIVSALQTTCRGNPSVTYESQPPTPSPPPAHKGSAVRNFYISNQPVLPIAVMLKWRRCSVLPSGPAICRLLVWCKILHHLARQGGWRSWCRGWWGRCRGRWQWRTRPEERDTRGPIY